MKSKHGKNIFFIIENCCIFKYCMIFIREKNIIKSQRHKVFITDMATNGNERKCLFYTQKTD